MAQISTDLAADQLMINLMPTVVAAGKAVGCRVSRPTCDLPVIGRIEQQLIFELPYAPIATQDQSFSTIATSSEGGQLPVDLFEPHPRPALDHTDDDLEDSCSETLLRFLNFHIERCSELAYPVDSSRSHQPNRESARRHWDQSRQIYWEHDDSEGPLRLIVRIADECTLALHSICTQPRRILRRDRQKLRFDRVQQIDDGCIRWLVRQPGRTYLEKAGPQRRVLAVARVESADTPENRVAKDFLARSIVACKDYLREHLNKNHTPRYRKVARFLALARRLSDSPVIAEIPALTGPPSANYVLQYDKRYSVIWSWYQRLRRQQTGLADAWVWRRRAFSEHVRFALSQSLSHFGEEHPYEKFVYVRSEQDRGCFLDSTTLLTPWRTATGHIHLLTAQDALQAISLGALPKWCAEYGADYILTTNSAQPIALVTSQFSMDDATDKRLQSAAERFCRSLDKRSITTSASLLQVIGNPRISEHTATVHRSRIAGTQRKACRVDLPLPPTGIPPALPAALKWLTAQEEPTQ